MLGQSSMRSSRRTADRAASAEARTNLMSTPEPRRDLSALRIDRDAETEESRLPIGRIVTWIVVLVLLGILGWIAYAKWVVPSRAPAVETIVVKPTVNVANPPLLTATGYLVASKQSKITPKISGKVVKLNFDVGSEVHAGDVLAVLESTNLRAQLDEAQASLSQAQREYNRQSALWRDGVTTRAAL